jgi:glutamine synthetase
MGFQGHEETLKVSTRTKKEKQMTDSLIYYVPPVGHNQQAVEELLKKHPEIKFVSLVGVDLGGNDTDEKIPVAYFLKNIKEMLVHGVQTDGSSVVLPEIATLNNARVDLIPDLTVNWPIDYNYDMLDEKTGHPTGTLRIPSFLIHNDTRRVDSRSVLKNAIDRFEKEIPALLKKHPKILESLGLTEQDEIQEIIMTSATELEFWVKTPDYDADVEQLTTSQVLQEQYWKRTIGPVRSALEKTLMMLDKFGLGVEMGHKEVGGVKAKLASSGGFDHIMEQLEIDWTYSNALQAADNETLVRNIVKETFMRSGLEVTFMAKPIEGIAGNGEHTHIGAAVKLKDGRKVNLFAPADMKKDFMSPIGWGALMGLLKNYEVVNPFVAATNDALNRLKPGFEAPVCIVASVGHNVEIPSRNRTVLAGLVRDSNNPLSTRFELRAPNPTSNTYLVLASVYQAALDGIKAVVKAGKTAKELEADFSKTIGEEKFYLEKNRAYRSESDVFEHFTAEQRDSMFGKPPATVWENISHLDQYPEKKKVLMEGNVFGEEIISSYRHAILNLWAMELKNRIIPDNMDFVRSCRRIPQTDNVADLDVVNWEKINHLRNYLMKDRMEEKSLFTQIRESIDSGDYETVSRLQIIMAEKMNELGQLYAAYKKNLFEVPDNQ